MSSRKNRSVEEQARRTKIRELLQESNISSMEDIQNLFNHHVFCFLFCSYMNLHHPCI